MSWEFGELHPFEVGDISTLAAWENDQESKVMDMLDYILFHYGGSCDKYTMDSCIQLFGVEYYLLPQWLKDKIDIIDIIE